MTGQMTLSEKRKAMDDFIKRVDPYKPYEPYHFDLRSYASYLEKNNIPAAEITTEMMMQFKK